MSGGNNKLTLDSLALFKKLQKISSIDDLTTAEYEQIIESAVNLEADTLLPNSSEEKAAVVFKYLFSSTEDILRIYTTSMSESLANNNTLLKGLGECTQKENVKIQILLDSVPSEDSKAYQLVKKHKGKWEIKLTNDDIRNDIADNFRDSTLLHFTTSDDKRYRLEQDNDSNVAICSFNETDFTKYLSDAFDRGFQASKPL